MPQRHGSQWTRTPGEVVHFNHMLSKVANLYVSIEVLVILDLSYLCRFWTSFEAW